MRVLIDLNVLLDVLQRREPFYAASAAVLSAAVRGEIKPCVPAHSLTTIHYIIARHAGREHADAAIDWILGRFEILAETREVFLRARSLPMNDFEDAVVAATAAAGRCDRIATRNVADFAGSPVPAGLPQEILALIPPPPPV